MEKEVKEKIRRKVLQQIPTGMDLDERYLADIIEVILIRKYTINKILHIIISAL